jgi:hypothetical protein
MASTIDGSSESHGSPEHITKLITKGDEGTPVEDWKGEFRKHPNLPVLMFQLVKLFETFGLRNGRAESMSSLNDREAAGVNDLQFQLRLAKEYEQNGYKALAMATWRDVLLYWPSSAEAQRNLRKAVRSWRLRYPVDV